MFFIIPETSQKKEIINPNFVFNKNEFQFNSAIFNPFSSHIIACSCSGNIIQVWSVKGPAIIKIPYSTLATAMKWSKCGKFLGFIDNDSILKIYDIIKKEFIFYLDYKNNINNYGFFGNDSILVDNADNNKIFKYKLNINQKGDLKAIKKNQYENILEVKYNHFLISTDYFILNSIENKIMYYSEFNTPIYNQKCILSNPRIIKSSNNNIISKILNIDRDNIGLIILYNKDKIQEKKNFKDNEQEKENKYDFEIDSIDITPDDLNEDYFKDCPKTFLNIIDNLNFKFNEDITFSKKKKAYFHIKEIETNLKYLENYDLISLRNEVKNEMEKIKEKEKKGKAVKEKIKLFKSIEEEYMFYLNLLIKDETNPDLLLRYLNFLKENEKYLENKSIPHETLRKEIEYYSIFIDKNELYKSFNYTFESQKYKLIKLLKEYCNSIKSGTFSDFQKKTLLEKNKRYVNQPISLKYKELMYYDCYDMVYNDICDDEKKDKKNLRKKLYIIDKILNKNLLDKYEQSYIVIPLFFFLCHAGEKKDTDFLLNMIESKSLKNEELKLKLSKSNGVLGKIDKKKTCSINNQYFDEPNELCFENINNKKYYQCEKYNFEYLYKNPPLKLKIKKIETLLKNTLKSRVFKEAYSYLTGRDNYEKIFNDNMISEFINKIIYVPIDFYDASSFHDSLGLITVISTMKKEINPTYVINDDDISIILENGVIVAIIYHEYGHAINAVISFKENKLEHTGTPRKKYFKFKGGGYYLEMVIFGKVIKNLSWCEALYILNENNYIICFYHKLYILLL